MELTLNASINDEARQDIIELQEKITSFQSGKSDQEQFRAFRLTRGVYGQRQDGVNMIRIKLPFGKLSPEQLIRIADISDKYASSNLQPYYPAGYSSSLCKANGCTTALGGFGGKRNNPSRGLRQYNQEHDSIVHCRHRPLRIV
jgi:hypothetical protein